MHVSIPSIKNLRSFKSSNLIIIENHYNCCIAYLLSCHQTASDTNYWTIRTLFIAIISSCLEESVPASEFPMFLWVSSNSCPLNLLLFWRHLPEIIIVKRLIQGRNNVTRVPVEPRLYDSGGRKNDVFALSVTLLTYCQVIIYYQPYCSNRQNF